MDAKYFGQPIMVNITIFHTVKLTYSVYVGEVKTFSVMPIGVVELAKNFSW